MGACTFIHKRTSDDIWKNLFELPLVETDRNLSEEEFLSSVSFRSLIAEGEVPEVRLVFRNVKHVLSHRVIYANFYEVVLPENSRSFSVCGCILVYLALFSDVLDTPIEFNNMAMIFGHWISIVTMQCWNTE